MKLARALAPYWHYHPEYLGRPCMRFALQSYRHIRRAAAAPVAPAVGAPKGIEAGATCGHRPTAAATAAATAAIAPAKRVEGRAKIVVKPLRLRRRPAVAAPKV